MFTVPQKPLVIDDPSQHTMGSSLLRYVETRTHEFVDKLEYRSIRVIGLYDRKTSASCKEKCDKPGNWQRPTARLVSGELQICCFPGQAYVFHYASLIATYLALTNRDPTIVKLALPSIQKTKHTISRSNYWRLDSTDVIVVGSGISNLTSPRNFRDYGTFQAKQELLGRNSITWLIVKHSFWGDIAYWLGAELASQGFSLIIFVGKLGSLNPQHIPNETLATGNQSVVNEENFSWNNLFSTTEVHEAVNGKHITLPSVLQETIDWKSSNSSVYSFVDPEIGNMSAGVLLNGSRYSYLHIISDNLSRQFSEDLSNERSGIIHQKRVELYCRISKILSRQLNSHIG